MTTPSGIATHVITKDSPRSVADTAARLTSLIEAGGMRLFAVIDQAAEAQQVGLELRPTIAIVFGSPASGTTIMDAAPLAALDLPLKIVIWADGDQTRVSYVSPAALVARYGLADELAQRLAGIDGLSDALVEV